MKVYILLCCFAMVNMRQAQAGPERPNQLKPQKEPETFDRNAWPRKTTHLQSQRSRPDLLRHNQIKSEDERRTLSGGIAGGISAGIGGHIGAGVGTGPNGGLNAGIGAGVTAGIGVGVGVGAGTGYPGYAGYPGYYG